ncbi:MsnO8 family LLM class oxidoreductase, partial [Actinomyces sp. 187325]|uniref:MsnO8 family LLM class oxidoreductase n=1 Tax=Actinomyces sp. 187325 TaxID=2927828 RepID=UPI002017C39A
MPASAPVLSVLDLVPVSAGRTRAQALAEMTGLARTAEACGYHRYWIAEHHGSTTYLAAATTVLMGQVLAATERIGVASGGIMLPNHAPLVVAEQVGTLAELYPGRVALGLGRAPGTDPLTASALRRRAADPRSFAQEVLETLVYLGQVPDDVPAAVPGSLVPGAGPGGRGRAVPGEGTGPQAWVLGSSVNGARVAGTLGLPLAVASHFAPAQAEAAVVTYRSVFDASAPTSPDARPHVAAAV